MEPYNIRFTKRTSSADLVFACGLSIVMHAVLLLVDPLVSFNVSDRLTEQQNTIIMVNLKDSVDEGQRNGMGPSHPAAAQKVSQGKREKKTRRKWLEETTCHR